MKYSKTIYINSKQINPQNLNKIENQIENLTNDLDIQKSNISKIIGADCVAENNTKGTNLKFTFKLSDNTSFDVDVSIPNTTTNKIKE